jgi:hypothetical protein
VPRGDIVAATMHVGHSSKMAGVVLGTVLVAAGIATLAVTGQLAPEAAAEPIVSAMTPTIVVPPASPASSATSTGASPSTSAAATGSAASKTGWAVDRVATPLGEVAIARILRTAHELELGAPPSKERLAVAWAHIALENARGEGIECNNFGNLTIWEREPGPHFVRILKERRPIKRGLTVTRWRWVEMRFRAFESPVAGARAYWAHLNDKFSDALAQFDFEDGHGAGHKLARLGYATAFSMRYADSIASLTGEYKRRIAPELVDDT